MYRDFKIALGLIFFSFVITGIAFSLLINQLDDTYIAKVVKQQVDNFRLEIEMEIKDQIKQELIKNSNTSEDQADFVIEKVVEQKKQEMNTGSKYNRILSGTIFFDQRWEGTILIEGDLFIPPHVDINIKPGTVIEIAETDKTPSDFDIEIGPDGFNDNDNSRLKSWKDKHVSIFAAGRLIANGTNERPIIFTSTNPNATYLAWGSLTLTGNQAYLNNVLVENNQAGITVPSPSENILVENSLVRNVFWGCFSIANSNGVYKNNIAENCGHEGFDIRGNPTLINNTVRYSHTSVVLIDGEPILKENIFQNEPETIDGEIIYEGYTMDRSLSCDPDYVWSYLNYNIPCEGEPYLS